MGRLCTRNSSAGLIERICAFMEVCILVKKGFDGGNGNWCLDLMLLLFYIRLIIRKN